MVTQQDLYTKNWQLTKDWAFINQRTNETKSFFAYSIIVQVEGVAGNHVAIRGKYPNDAYFSNCLISTLKEAV